MVVEHIEANTAEIHAVPSPQLSAASNSGQGRMLLYQVEVKSQGSHIAQHIVEAVDALTAINLVEQWYGEPVEVETVWVENEDGSRRQKIIVKNWHGYTFDARMIEP